MALLILALLQRIFLMSSLMLLLVWLIFFMVLIKLLPILGTISGKTVKLMVLALICLGNRSEERFSRNAETDLVCRLLLEKKKKKVMKEQHEKQLEEQVTLCDREHLAHCHSHKHPSNT